MVGVAALYLIERERELEERVEKGGPDGLLKRCQGKTYVEASDCAELID